jgi:2-polyprenyl-6-methoxyphenol hydroxylase-like FAD-dependent oxidoreductase
MPPGSRESAMADVAPVIIVGGGPVGMVLAMDLAALGVRSVVVNTETDTRWHPKGSTQNARTMEHYRRHGLTGAIRRLGLPADQPTDVGYFTALDGWELARLKMPSESQKMQRRSKAGVTDQEPEPLFRCNQMHVERHLYQHLKTLDAVERRFGWRCTGFTDHGDNVSATIEEIASGRRETLSGAYIVGCDGGQSVIRRGLGIRYSGEVPQEQAYGSGATVSTHLRAPAVYDLIRQSCWQYWIVSAKARANLVSIDGRGEFLLNTRCRSVDEPPDRDMIARIFRTSVGRDVPVEFIGYWPWTAGQALVADSFGAGRALLAGDAVHLFTPTGGFGMNTGIDDSANLGWKLAALVQGWGGPRLFASYEAERRPIALRNTSHAKRLSRSLADIPVTPQMEDDSAEGAASREAAARVLSGFGEEFASLGVQLGARYDGSPIVVSDGSAPPPDDPAISIPTETPGGRAPHVWLPDRRSLYDRLGRFFTLLRLPGCRDDGVAFSAAARARKIPLEIVDVGVPEARGLYGAGMALIRPDQHVAWRGDRAPDDCDALLAAVTGW